MSSTISNQQVLRHVLGLFVIAPLAFGTIFGIGHQSLGKGLEIAVMMVLMTFMFFCGIAILAHGVLDEDAD